MKPTEENRTMNPGEKREPGDVYMVLSPEGKAQAVSTNDLLYKDFGQFVYDCTYYMFKNWIAPYPNSFFVHYHFDEPARVWDPYENISMFPRKLMDAVKEQGLKPLKICRLYPVMYCYQNGLDPLRPENSHEALNKSMAYQSAVWRYSGLERSREQTYTGIETDRGVLLFDNTEQGEKLQKRYKDFFAANFFDPRLDITFLRVMELIPDEAQRAKVNPDIDLNTLFRTEPEPFGCLPAGCYTDKEKIAICDTIEQFGMSATLANFAALSGFDKGEIPDNVPAHTYDISCLLYLASPECKVPEIQDEFPNFFSYHDRFDPLADRLTQATTENEKTQIMASVRKLARELLREQYPNIRRPQAAAPGLKEQFGFAEVTAEKPARQLPDVAKKLANRLKKGKGVTR